MLYFAVLCINEIGTNQIHLQSVCGAQGYFHQCRESSNLDVGGAIYDMEGRGNRGSVHDSGMCRWCVDMENWMREDECIMESEAAPIGFVTAKDISSGMA